MTGSLAALLLVAGLSACAGDPKDQPTTLPPITATPTPSSSAGASGLPTPASTSGLSDREQVRATYTWVFTHLGVADTLNYKRSREYYSRGAVDPALRAYARGGPIKKGQETVGEIVPHIVEIKMHRRTAMVYDCADDSSVITRNIRTGKVIERGQTHLRLIAELKLTEDGWRVYTSSAEKGSCTRG